MTKPQVSVVIPAYNEEKYIQNSLFSLLRSEQKTEINYEVILVDNNSTDNTVKEALQFKEGMDLRVVKEPKQGRGAARARGFKEAKGDIILSADADTIFYAGWIEKLASALKGDFIAVTTSCKIIDSSGVNNFLFSFFQPLTMVLYRLFLGHYWLSGFSFGIKKDIYEKSGGFDSSLQAQEDTELSFRVAKLGKVKFINKPVVFSGRRFKKGLIHGFLEYVQSYNLAIIKKRKNVYLNNPR